MRKVTIVDTNGKHEEILAYTDLLRSYSEYFEEQIKETLSQNDSKLQLSGVRVGIFEVFVRWGNSHDNEIILSSRPLDAVNKGITSRERILQKLDDLVDCYILALKIVAVRFKIAVINEVQKTLCTRRRLAIHLVKKVFDNTHRDSPLRKLIVNELRKEGPEVLSEVEKSESKDFYVDMWKASYDREQKLLQEAKDISELVPRNKRQKLDEESNAMSMCEYHQAEIQPLEQITPVKKLVVLVRCRQCQSRATGPGQHPSQVRSISVSVTSKRPTVNATCKVEATEEPGVPEIPAPPQDPRLV